MTSEAISQNNQAFTSMLCGKYLKILTYSALTLNEGSTISLPLLTTTHIFTGNSVLYCLCIGNSQ